MPNIMPYLLFILLLLLICIILFLLLIFTRNNLYVLEKKSKKEKKVIDLLIARSILKTEDYQNAQKVIDNLDKRIISRPNHQQNAINHETSIIQKSVSIQEQPKIVQPENNESFEQKLNDPVTKNNNLTLEIPKFIQNKAQKKHRTMDKLNAINIMLITGIIFIALAGIILATGQFVDIADFVRVIIIICISLIFFAFSFLAEKKLKLEKTAQAFYILGSFFLPLSLISIGYLNFLGTWYSMTGEGVYLLCATSTLFFGIAILFGAIKYQFNLLANVMWFALMITIVFITLYFTIEKPIISLIFSIYVIFCISLRPLIIRCKKANLQQIITSYDTFVALTTIIFTITNLIISDFSLFSGISILLLSIVYLHNLFNKKYQNTGAYIFSLTMLFGLFRLINPDDFQGYLMVITITSITAAIFSLWKLILPKVRDILQFSSAILIFIGLIINATLFIFNDYTDNMAILFSVITSLILLLDATIIGFKNKHEIIKLEQTLFLIFFFFHLFNYLKIEQYLTALFMGLISLGFFIIYLFIKKLRTMSSDIIFILTSLISSIYLIFLNQGLLTSISAIVTIIIFLGINLYLTIESKPSVIIKSHRWLFVFGIYLLTFPINNIINLYVNINLDVIYFSIFMFISILTILSLILCKIKVFEKLQFALEYGSYVSGVILLFASLTTSAYIYPYLWIISLIVAIKALMSQKYYNYIFIGLFFLSFTLSLINNLNNGFILYETLAIIIAFSLILINSYIVKKNNLFYEKHFNPLILIAFAIQLATLFTDSVLIVTIILVSISIIANSLFYFFKQFKTNTSDILFPLVVLVSNLMLFFTDNLLENNIFAIIYTIILVTMLLIISFKNEDLTIKAIYQYALVVALYLLIIPINQIVLLNSPSSSNINLITFIIFMITTIITIILIFTRSNRLKTLTNPFIYITLVSGLVIGIILASLNIYTYPYFWMVCLIACLKYFIVKDDNQIILRFSFHMFLFAFLLAVLITSMNFTSDVYLISSILVGLSLISFILYLILDKWLKKAFAFIQDIKIFSAYINLLLGFILFSIFLSSPITYSWLPLIFIFSLITSYISFEFIKWTYVSFISIIITFVSLTYLQNIIGLELEMLIAIAFAVTIAILGYFTHKKIMNGDVIDFASILSILVIFHLNFEFKYQVFASLIACALYSLVYYKRINHQLANPIPLTFSIAFISLALITQPFMIIDQIFVNEYSCIMIAIFAFTLLPIWKNYAKSISHFTFTIITLIVLYLGLLAIISNELFDAIFLGISLVVLLIASFFIKRKRYFLLSTVSILFISIYLSRTFWLSIAWWIYLITIGFILVAIATINEILKRKQNSLSTTIKKIFSDWEW